MTDLATYSRSGPVGTIVIDDGKANVMSLAMLNALHGAFDQAEKDGAIVILKAAASIFPAVLISTCSPREAPRTST
jgi:enoyl-CoA hydratase